MPHLRPKGAALPRACAIGVLTLALCSLPPPVAAYPERAWNRQFPLPTHPQGLAQVEEQRAVLLKQLPYLQKRLTQVQPLIRWVSEEVKTRNLPPLLAFVPLVETSYRLEVVSHAGAAGPWQLMPDTATRFAVPITADYDGRYSLPLASDAGLTYLTWLNKFFGGDWLLTLAGYNAGEGRILKAVLNGRSKDVWKLKIPTETRNYVARFIALADLLANARRYNLMLPDWRSGPNLQVVRKPDSCNLLSFARQKGVAMNDIMNWNPGWRLPELARKNNCPIVYLPRLDAAPAGTTSEAATVVASTPPSGPRTVSLESVRDPLMLQPVRGLDLAPSGINLAPVKDPFGLGSARPLIQP
ncbi:MAG: transglycosylase SLT domain-containing protein [Aeromonas sp.]